MRRTYIALALGLLAMLGLSAPAMAGTGWCRSDPIIEIDGQLSKIVVSGPPRVRSLVTGPTQIIISVPVGSATKLVATTPGFGQGEEITFVESPALTATAEGVEVQVAVYVPAVDDAMPVQVEAAALGAGTRSPAVVAGTANTWLTVSTVLGR